MPEPTNEEANPLKPVEEDQFSKDLDQKLEETKAEVLKKMEEHKTESVTNPPDPESIPGKDVTPKAKNITPEMEAELKRLLRNTNRGRGLMVRLDAIGRPDLYKNATQILWVKDIQAIDVKVQPFDLNPGLFEQFRSYCWNNGMTYRFDDTSGVVVLIVRWFLPDVLPVIDAEIKTFAMAEPVKTEPSTLKKTPDLKEVK